MPMRRFGGILLATTGLTCIWAVGPAHGQAQAQAQAQAQPQSVPVSGEAVPQDAVKGSVENVQVVGRSARGTQPGGGLMKVETAPKAVQTISRDFIAKQSPTTNAQQLLRMLPSANVSDADPFGLASGQTRVRGLDETEIGWLMDGMPLNDIGGGQFYANEILEAEDLDTVSLQPGSVNIDSPTVNASGGLVSMTMTNPTHRAGGLADFSFGSYGLNREFLRLNTGDIGNTGLRAMIAYSHTYANNWNGPGSDNKHHIDFKAVKDFDNGSFTSLTVAYNDQINYFTVNPTQAQYLANGNQNSYASTYTGPLTGSNFYKLHVNPFAEVITSAPSNFVINSHLSISDTPYFWHGIGNGTGGSTLTENKAPGVAGGSASSPVGTFYGDQLVNVDLNGDGKINGGKALVLSPSNQEQFRPGNTLKLDYTLGNQHLTAGWWYEYSNLYQYSPISYVNQTNGIPENIWGVDNRYQLPGGQYYNARDFLTLTQVNMLFLADRADYFDHHLHIETGFKEAMVHRETYDYTPGATYNRNLSTAEPLPQFGASWQFNAQNQVYVTGSTNFRTPSNTSLVDYFSNTTGKLTQQGGSSKPEYSIAEEIGYRYNGSLVIGSISFFNYNFTNRQLTLNYILGGANYSQTVNAGGQTSRGFDAQIATRPLLFHLRPYATFEYLDARIDNNLQTTSVLNGKTIVDYLPTTGKTQIGSPKIQAGIGLDYDDGAFFAGVDLKYVGDQYSTFMNDQKNPDYITNNMNFGYRFHGIGVLKAPQVQLNLANLTGATYRTGVYTFQNNANATRGVFGGKVSGSNPAYYLQPGFSAVLTLSSAF